MQEVDKEQLGEMLSAFLDGELDDAESRFVESLLRESATVRRWLRELRTTVSVVSSLPRPAAPESVLADIRLQLERRALLGETERTDAGAETPAPRDRGSFKSVLAMAAMLGFAVVIGYWAVLGPRPARTPAARGRVAIATKNEPQPATGTTRARRQTVKRRRSAKLQAESTRAASAGRTLAEKLSAGADVAALRLHDFSNETVRLRWVADSESDQEVAAARLTKRLESLGLASLDGSAHRGTRGSGGAAPKGFFYTGTSDVNFQGESQRQILVRLPAHQVAALLEGLTSTHSAGGSTSLQAGGITFRGADSVRRALRQLDPIETGSQSDVAIMTRGRSAASQETAPAEASSRRRTRRAGAADSTPEGALAPQPESQQDPVVLAFVDGRLEGPPPPASERVPDATRHALLLQLAKDLGIDGLSWVPNGGVSRPDSYAGRKPQAGGSPHDTATGGGTQPPARKSLVERRMRQIRRKKQKMDVIPRKPAPSLEADDSDYVTVVVELRTRPPDREQRRGTTPGRVRTRRDKDRPSSSRTRQADPPLR